jgi:hypothetical protein
MGALVATATSAVGNSRVSMSEDHNPRQSVVKQELIPAVIFQLHAQPLNVSEILLA